MEAEKKLDVVTFCKEIEEALDFAFSTQTTDKISELDFYKNKDKILELLYADNSLMKQDISKIEEIKKITRENLDSVYNDFLVGVKEKQEKSHGAINSKKAEKNSFVRAWLEKELKEDEEEPVSGVEEKQKRSLEVTLDKAGKNSFVGVGTFDKSCIKECLRKSFNDYYNVKDDLDLLSGEKSFKERKNNLKKALKGLIKVRRSLLFDMKSDYICTKLLENIVVLEKEYLKAKKAFKGLKKEKRNKGME
jgi:hypothetical protein